MSAREDLGAILNGDGPQATPTESTDDLRAWLTGQLGVPVVGVDVFGRGPNASVDIRLSDGLALKVERFADIAKPAALAAHLVTTCGVYKTFKGPEAGEIAAAVFRLAKHHHETDADDVAREWGREYLRNAPTQDVDLNDQAARWAAFCDLARLQPARDAGEDRSAYALAATSIVLVDPQSGGRLVRAGWFQAYVKREVGGLYSPAALNVQMQRVGWKRCGKEGRVKATNPTDGRHLSFNFYAVPADWGDAEVPPGSTSNACTRTRARCVDQPAGTWNPRGGAA
jgi:hypothetical protein